MGRRPSTASSTASSRWTSLRACAGVVYAWRMELEWLEDFISLARSGSFSRSATERHVTQPAFSRRIQALELWLGVALIDRSAYPTRLTPAGRQFREVA